jgi:hypothetical protein
MAECPSEPVPCGPRGARTGLYVLGVPQTTPGRDLKSESVETVMLTVIMTKLDHFSRNAYLGIHSLGTPLETPS